jgi:hypothetical protein
VALPEPRPGLVIRHDYLWVEEAAAGRDQGEDRPVCIVAASDSSIRPRFVAIVPITHSAPTDTTLGIEIPLRVRQAIGLDDKSSWVIVSEHNVDEWPNAGIQPIRGRPGTFAYGFIPPRLFARIKARFLDLARHGGSSGVQR